MNIADLMITDDLNILKDNINKSLKHKMAIAGNDNCPISILEILANESSFDLLVILIDNKNCTFEIIKKIYYKNNLGLQYQIAVFSKINEVLEMVSLSNDPHVIYFLVQNKNCSSNILKRIYRNLYKYSDLNCDTDLLTLIKRNPNWVLNEFE